MGQILKILLTLHTLQRLDELLYFDQMCYPCLFISVGHRNSLKNFHENLLYFNKDDQNWKIREIINEEKEVFDNKWVEKNIKKDIIEILLKIFIKILCILIKKL
jgi:hypothetical protein